MFAVDLNCDLGESFGNYKCGLDEEVIPFISSANVACGFHASDPVVMAKTVALAKEQGVRVGAHPGYPDLVGFGRRNLAASPAEVKAMVQYQIGALKAFCTAQGIKLQHVKPHGAMYNMAGKDEKLATAIAEAIKEVDPELILLAPSSSKMMGAAKAVGLRVAKEVFADRAYEEDEAVARVIKMIKEGTVTAITGKEIPVEANSVCVHGDGPKALAFVQKIRKALEAENIRIASIEEVIGK